MTGEPSQPTWRWWKYLLLLAAVGSVGALALSIYINTESFQAFVRRRLVSQIEHITGGRAQVGSLHTIPFRLQVEVRNITVHGRESATEISLAHAESITARLKLSSLLRSEFAFHDLVLDQPVIHVAFYPDGSSNFPQRSTNISGQSAAEKLFALSIDRLEVRRGQMIWDNQVVPFELNVHDAALRMDYSFLHARYNGQVSVGAVDSKLPGCMPFAWMSSADFSLAADSATINSLQWNSGHSNVSAHGEILGFRNPRVQATYEARIDLSEAASIKRIRGLRTGTLQARGSGDWALDKFSTKGLLSLTDLAWKDLAMGDASLSLAKADVTTDYAITDDQLKLTKMEGKVFGGSFTGDAEINQWLAPDQHLSPVARKALDTAVISAAPPLRAQSRETPKPKPPAVQSAAINLHLRNISAADIAAAFNSQAHPVPDLHLAALTSGTIQTRWKGTRRDAEIQFSLDTSPPERVPPSSRPLNAQASGTYNAATNRLDLSPVHTQYARLARASRRNFVFDVVASRCNLDHQPRGLAPHP